MLRFIVCLLLLSTGLLAGQTDSLLSSVHWEEMTAGDRKGYLIRFNPFGTFEEDAGEVYARSARYLMGRYEIDSTQSVLTFAVDFFMGDKLVHRRYRRGQDFYLDYDIVSLKPERLELRDKLTREIRTFVAKPLEGVEDAATRRINKIQFGKKGGLKLPGGWDGGGR
ncbi:MAG: hypothetical protein AAF840_04495 [Bacteroidota bacterium]